MPSSAVSALADDIAQEVPDLDDRGVMTRAGDLLARTLAEREATRLQNVAEAKARIAAIDAAEADRTAATR